MPCLFATEQLPARARLAKICVTNGYPQQRAAVIGIRETYVRVRKAAEILGVAPNTVRAWGAAGKIPEFRHPVNKHRLYRREDLTNLLRSIEEPSSSDLKSRR